MAEPLRVLFAHLESSSTPNDHANNSKWSHGFSRCQTAEQLRRSCSESLKARLMRTRGGEAAEARVYAAFDTKCCSEKVKSR